MSGTLATPAPGGDRRDRRHHRQRHAHLGAQGGGSAASVAVKPGDTIVWKATTATHGVVFDTQAIAQPAATLLAQATVKPGVPPARRSASSAASTAAP